MQPAIKFNPLSSHHTKYIDLCPKTKCHNLELSNDEFISPQTPPSATNTPLSCWSSVCALPSFPRRARRVMTKTSRKKRQLTFCTAHVCSRAHIHPHTRFSKHQPSSQHVLAKEKRRKNAVWKRKTKRKRAKSEGSKVMRGWEWAGEAEKSCKCEIKSEQSEKRSNIHTHTHTRTWCGESHSSVLNNALGFAKVRTKVRESGERAREVSEKIDWRSTPRKEQRASAHFGERFSSPLWADFLTAVRPNRSMRERERESSCKSNNCFGSRTRATTRGVCNSRLPLWTKHTGAAKTAWHRRVCVLESVKNR